MLTSRLQIKVASSAAVPFVLHRGGVLESVAVRATPRFGPADNEPRFTNVAIRCVLRCGCGCQAAPPINRVEQTPPAALYSTHHTYSLA